MKCLFSTQITKIGNMVDSLIQEKMMVIFDEDAPEELHDMSILHTKSPCFESVRSGDYLVIGDQSFRVTSVGEKVNETLRELGHCTIKFEGKDRSELPGILQVEASEPVLELHAPLMFVRK
ncbi:PTS system glucitol/sorbitol-specific IIA component [Planifilum fimeticola]|uniref:PTS system glucitol/sorbitol-specific IIA component n=1 Tax=Planifilum fimeticola TaxID=201975 RepID=A0A2T0LCA3_9BACL|nr:PTS glucitol/sorbitol transporter subunit IIA [Planifilum fimeticola]PRX39598.1 PTS system glucitol/sorbitol-specific IIA component [Planifilum fimeticola]